MPDLLFELGIEELPATFVRKAYKDLETAITGRLTEAGLTFTGSESMGTPRRLIVHVKSVLDRQADLSKDMRGPSLSTAFDADGNPTKALEGFCRGQGVTPADVRNDGEYVWVTKLIPGKPASEVLAEILPEAVKSLTFEKTMRWGSARMRFARPIRWILASLGGNLVPFTIETIASGLESRGHRFNHPAPFKATTMDELLNGLLSRDVEPDPNERERRIRESTTIIASGTPQMTDALVDENVFLTEWPTPIEGEFPPEYLELPEPVLVTAMAKHEKMFPVRGSDGKLKNKFVFVRNSGQDDVVSAGASWVLSARFNDAKFFFDEDKQHSLDHFLAKCGGIVFQEKLGSVLDRAYRLESLAATIAKATGADDNETQQAAKAGLYCKADLSSGLVSELPALQGVIGGEYAKREGFDAATCWAIATHYDLAKNSVSDSLGARTALRVTIADQMDKLVGYLGVGLVPSGSSDPFGLRRAATILIEASLSWPGIFPDYQSLLAEAVKVYSTVALNADAVVTKAQEIFGSRYQAIFSETRHDVLDAAVVEPLSPQIVAFRIETLNLAAQDVKFIQTATRPLNIVNAAAKKGETWDAEIASASLQSKEGDVLLQALQAKADAIQGAFRDRNSVALVAALKTLEDPINSFFDSTMIMVEDVAIRRARLGLLAQCGKLLVLAGDVSKLVSE